MLTKRQIELLNTLKLRTRADETAIIAAMTQIGGTLPDDYVALLRHSNGGSGLVNGRGYIDFFPIEEVPEVCSLNQVERSAPGLLPFASDCGGNVFAFDRRSSPMGIVHVPLIGISWDNSKVVVASVGDLLMYLGST
jgi:hypothetical protein